MKFFNKMTVTAMFLVFILVQTLLPANASADELTNRNLEKEMRAMIEMGVISGFDDGSIKPTGNVTREQFAAFLARALDLPPGEPVFTDVSGSLSDSINAINKAGLMNGYSDMTFKPTELITREQLMVTMKNVLVYSDMELKEERIAFTDTKDFISSGGIRATYNSIAYGITSGYENGETGTFRFEPKSNASREQAAAFIYRFLEAKENYVPPFVEPPVDPEPPIEPPVTPPVDPTLYQLAIISNNELVKTETTYKTFNEALAVYNSNPSYEAIYRGKDIMKVKPGGIAYGDNTVTYHAPNTVVYFDPQFTQQATFIERGREMRYIDSTADYIKVQVAATEGYVKHSETTLKPKTLIGSTNRDYYDVSQWNTLIHHYTNHYTNKNEWYAVGPAPTFMDQGPQYFSHDSIHFMDSNGKGIGTNFPYFQYVSPRTTTEYTAEEIDAYIVKILNEKYPLRASESKLIGLGSYLKKLEVEKRVNALFILSLAVHEGTYGLSNRALQCNNLIGLHIYDSTTKTCPKEGTFATPEEGIDSLVDDFWNSRYINPEFMGNPARNMGAAFGNKTTGFNVNYASDPTWGAKIAAHMLKMDADMGKKDLNKFKKILFTKYEVETRVRKGPSTDSEVLYAYRPRNVGVYKDSLSEESYSLGYPLTVVDSVEVGQYTWYQVYADKFVDQTSPVYGWIRSDVVEIVEYP